MKKRALFRCILGAPLGLALSYVITVFISLTVNDGSYYAVVPELITDCCSEMGAVLLQTVLSLIYGAAWAGASVIWEMEEWSILKQTMLHLGVCSIATFPIAYFTRWMSHDLKGILLYFGIFFCTYVIIWLIQYSALRRRVKRINEGINNRR